MGYRSSVGLASVGWALGIVAIAAPALSAPPETSPASLTTYLTTIETAANSQDLPRLMALYAQDFQGPDGFTREQYENTLREFWTQYSDLMYDVELLSWEPEGTAFVTETLTRVQGTQQTAGRTTTLTATVRSRQRYENGQIVFQEILAEQSQLASGSNPPTVQVNLPTSVSPGSRFNFDAIVKEPLGDRVLLGIALDEGVTAQDFLTPRPLDLQSLPAGGLFKVGKAPDSPDQRWISAVLVRNDGIVIETRRLRVAP
jgi:hypothetical protein